jgi:glucosamine-6-phosphate deaminase
LLGRGQSTSHVDPRDLYKSCKIPAEELPERPDLRVRFRIVRDSDEMDQLMGREFLELTHENNT